MEPAQYLDHHIPHRINLLCTFRTRYSRRHESNRTLKPETYRDLFRCAKDICFIMTRFFFEEMGIVLDKRTQKLKNKGNWNSRHKTTRLDLSAVESDSRSRILIEMLKAANGAVAHMDDERVAHYFRTSQEEQEMVRVIDWIEELVQTHIYKPNGRNLSDALRLQNNRMVHE